MLSGFAMISVGRSLRDDLAAMLTRARPDIHDPVGRGHRFLVMLHDNNGIAQSAQAHQRVDQLGVVPLVQADDGLVQDIQNAGEARPDLRRQADALRLAARQGRARPVQGQIAQADIEQKAEPRSHLRERSAVR